jgi:outer membrane scaffolding protein for murein synthesis (MipA/OmpV family)
MRTTIIRLLPLVLCAELEAQEPRQAPSPWAITFGAAAVIVPQYPGSDEYRILPFPMSQVIYNNRIFLGPSSGGPGGAVGAYAIRTSRVGLAAEVGIQDSRPASRADALAGTADRDVVATAGASLTYHTGQVEWLVAGARGLNDGAGFLGSVRVSTSRRFARLIAGAGIGATIADARQMRRDFGVSEFEATQRQALIDAGDARLEPGDGSAYRPGGGLHHVGASLSLTYLVSPRWSLVGFGGVDRLSDEATESPLVRRREQFSGGIGLGYRL